MTRYAIPLLLCVVILFSGFQVSGDELTDTQKELWKIIESWWEYFKQGDLEGLSAYYDFEGSLEWSPSNPIPLAGKKAIMLSHEEWINYDKLISYELEPINIYIVGDVANVYYLWKFKGNILSGNGRQMDTYVKKNNKWNFIGGMGCSCKELPNCK